MERNPNIRSAVDNSLYFTRFSLKEPRDGSAHVKLGNWEEILTDEEQAAGAQPSRSKDNRDDGLFCKDLAPPADCTSNVRLAQLNVGHWPIIVFTNFIGERFLNYLYNLTPSDRF